MDYPLETDEVLEQATTLNLNPRMIIPILGVFQVPGGTTKKPGLIHWEESAGGWAIRFPTADATVVRRTLSTVVENPNGLVKPGEEEPSGDNPWASIKPVNYGCYVIQKSIVGVIGVFIIGFLLVALGMFKFGQKLLIQYPEIFSLGAFHKEGPSEEEIRQASFKMWFVGRGYSNGAQVTTAEFNILT